MEGLIKVSHTVGKMTPKCHSCRFETTQCYNYNCLLVTVFAGPGTRYCPYNFFFGPYIMSTVIKLSAFRDVIISAFCTFSFVTIADKSVMYPCATNLAIWQKFSIFISISYSTEHTDILSAVGNCQIPYEHSSPCWQWHLLTARGIQSQTC